MQVDSQQRHLSDLPGIADRAALATCACKLSAPAAAAAGRCHAGWSAANGRSPYRGGAPVQAGQCTKVSSISGIRPLLPVPRCPAILIKCARIYAALMSEKSNTDSASVLECCERWLLFISRLLIVIERM
jgi:hypothetical protein